jgi:hypothetical protein
MQAVLIPGKEKWNTTFLNVDTYWDWVQHSGELIGFPQVGVQDVAGFDFY